MKGKFLKKSAFWDFEDNVFEDNIFENKAGM